MDQMPPAAPRYSINPLPGTSIMPSVHCAIYERKQTGFLYFQQALQAVFTTVRWRTLRKPPLQSYSTARRGRGRCDIDKECKSHCFPSMRHCQLKDLVPPFAPITQGSFRNGCTWVLCATNSLTLLARQNEIVQPTIVNYIGAPSET